MADLDRLPQLKSFEDVVRLVIEELGALCPSLERLAAYRLRPNAPEFSDVRYHIREAHCQLCRTELA